MIQALAMIIQAAVWLGLFYMGFKVVVAYGPLGALIAVLLFAMLVRLWPEGRKTTVIDGEKFKL